MWQLPCSTRRRAFCSAVSGLDASSSITSSTLRPADLALHLIEVELHALDHFLAARRDYAGEWSQQADLDRGRLR